MGIKRIGKDSAIRNHIPGKCGGCLFAFAVCDEMIVTKEYRGGEMVISKCTGYRREVLSVQDIKDWQEKHGLDADLPVTQKQLREENLKAF